MQFTGSRDIYGEQISGGVRQSQDYDGQQSFGSLCCSSLSSSVPLAAAMAVTKSEKSLPVVGASLYVIDHVTSRRLVERGRTRVESTNDRSAGGHGFRGR